VRVDARGEHVEELGVSMLVLAVEGGHSGEDEERLLRVPRVTGLVQIE